jgi:hypothetical protein
MSTEELLQSLDPTSLRRSRTRNRRPPEARWSGTPRCRWTGSWRGRTTRWTGSLGPRSVPACRGVRRNDRAVLGGRDRFNAYPDVSVIYGGARQGPVFVLTHHPEDAQPAEGVTLPSWDVAEAVPIGLEAAGGGKNLQVFSPTIGAESSSSHVRWGNAATGYEPVAKPSAERGGVQAAIRQGAVSSGYRCCSRTERQRRRWSPRPAAAGQHGLPTGYRGCPLPGGGAADRLARRTLRRWGGGPTAANAAASGMALQ